MIFISKVYKNFIFHSQILKFFFLGFKIIGNVILFVTKLKTNIHNILKIFFSSYSYIRPLLKKKIVKTVWTKIKILKFIIMNKNEIHKNLVTVIIF